jgi:hypothetical protein
MCHIGEFNMSQGSLTSPAALAALRSLPKDNPRLYGELSQTTVEKDEAEDDLIVASAGVSSDVGEEPYSNLFYDDCDVPVDVVVAHIASGSTTVADNFVVAADSGIVRAGNAENSDAEEEAAVFVAAPVNIGRGQCKKFGSKRYDDAAWEGH